MIALNSSTKSLEIICGATATTNNLDVVLSYERRVSKYSGQQGSLNSYVPYTIDNDFNEQVNVDTNGTTAVEICPAPTLSDDVWIYSNVIKSISVHNNDTVSTTVTIRINDASTYYTVIKVALPSLYSLSYTSESGWRFDFRLC